MTDQERLVAAIGKDLMDLINEHAGGAVAVMGRTVPTDRTAYEFLINGYMPGAPGIRDTSQHQFLNVTIKIARP